MGNRADDVARAYLWNDHLGPRGSRPIPLPRQLAAGYICTSWLMLRFSVLRLACVDCPHGSTMEEWDYGTVPGDDRLGLLVVVLDAACPVVAGVFGRIAAGGAGDSRMCSSAWNISRQASCHPRRTCRGGNAKACVGYSRRRFEEGNGQERGQRPGDGARDRGGSGGGSCRRNARRHDSFRHRAPGLKPSVRR